MKRQLLLVLVSGFSCVALNAMDNSDDFALPRANFSFANQVGFETRKKARMQKMQETRRTALNMPATIEINQRRTERESHAAGLAATQKLTKFYPHIDAHILGYANSTGPINDKIDWYPGKENIG